jgi:hypothetical protein
MSESALQDPPEVVKAVTVCETSFEVPGTCCVKYWCTHFHAVGVSW